MVPPVCHDGPIVEVPPWSGPAGDQLLLIRHHRQLKIADFPWPDVIAGRRQAADDRRRSVESPPEEPGPLGPVHRDRDPGAAAGVDSDLRRLVDRGGAGGNGDGGPVVVIHQHLDIYTQIKESDMPGKFGPPSPTFADINEK